MWKMRESGFTENGFRRVPEIWRSALMERPERGEDRRRTDEDGDG